MSELPFSNAELLPVDETRLTKAIREHIAEADFPCVGAKAALAKDMLRVVGAWSIDSAWDDLKLHRLLMDWSRDYERDPAGLRSFVVVFSQPLDLAEEQFEAAMWDRLQSLADKDTWLSQPYDARVSSNPEDLHFSLSFGKQAYFVVGMHPNASRPARRAPYPALVFNLHDQFERLRAEGRYERMREKILERDERFSGSLNPMLAQHGEASEARQYSGRQVDDGWKCPFMDPRS